MTSPYILLSAIWAADYQLYRDNLAKQGALISEINAYKGVFSRVPSVCKLTAMNRLGQTAHDQQDSQQSGHGRSEKIEQVVDRGSGTEAEALAAGNVIP